MSGRLAPLLVAAVLTFGPFPALAQDASYWTQQYGTRGLLLNGIVIASAVDLSATYYNPGTLALVRDPQVVLAARAFDWTSTDVDSFPGQHAILAPNQLPKTISSFLPSFFGGLLPWRIAGSSPIAYSIFPRQDSRFSVALYSNNPNPVDSPGGAVFDQLQLYQSLNETWAGLTWSRRYGKHFGVGISPFAAIRSEEVRRQLIEQSLTPTGGATATGNYWFSFYRWSLLAKLGVAYEDSERGLRLGLTFTSPQLPVISGGSANYDRFVLGSGAAGGSVTPSLEASFQPKLKSSYSAPLSVGAGIAWNFKHNRVQLSAEWFPSVPRTEVLNVQPFISQTTGQVVPFSVTTEQNSVVNWGIGFEHDLNAKTSLTLAFATNNSANKDDQSQTEVVFWGTNLATVGTTFMFRRTTLALGIGYGWGGGNPTAGGGSGEIPDSLFVRLSDRKVSTHMIRLIFGFSVGADGKDAKGEDGGDGEFER